MAELGFIPRPILSKPGFLTLLCSLYHILVDLGAQEVGSKPGSCARSWCQNHMLGRGSRLSPLSQSLSLTQNLWAGEEAPNCLVPQNSLEKRHTSVHLPFSRFGGTVRVKASGGSS